MRHRTPWYLAFTLATAGCQSPEVVQEPPKEPDAPGPVPVLAFVENSTHRYRHNLKSTMEFPDRPEMGTIRMEIETGALHTLLGRTPEGAGRVEVVADRSRGVVEFPSMGLHWEFDSGNEAHRKIAESEGPMQAAYRMMMAEVGEPRVWVVPAAQGKSPRAERPRGPCETGGLVAVADILSFAWLDLLPRRSLRTGEAGEGEGEVVPGLLGDRSLGGFTWRTASWDPGTGIAEIVTACRPEATGDGPKGRGARLEGGDLEIRDRFDVGRGVYLSRVLSLHGTMSGEGFLAPPGQRSTARVDLELRLEREPGEPPPGAREAAIRSKPVPAPAADPKLREQPDW